MSLTPFYSSTVGTVLMVSLGKRYYHRWDTSSKSQWAGHHRKEDGGAPGSFRTITHELSAGLQAVSIGRK